VVVDAMISWSDLTATILDFADVTVAAGQLDGRIFSGGGRRLRHGLGQGVGAAQTG
jgi:hypothetical protein